MNYNVFDGGELGIQECSGNRPLCTNQHAVSNFTLRPGAAAVPEPATWALMIVGLGAAGGALRARRPVARLRRA